MADITFTSPNVLASGVVASIVKGAINPQVPSCGLPVGGTFNWLLQLDTGTGSLRTGGAAPVASPELGYSFTSGALQTFSVAPITGQLLGSGCGPFSSSPAALLTVPVFLDQGGTQSVVLPLRQFRIANVVVSQDRDCIGVHNAAGLDPQNNCLPDSVHPLFLHDGGFHAFISLEDADLIAVDVLSQSLCVLLSGDPSTFGNGAFPTEKCTRDGMGKIVFAGNWCTSDTPATGACHDAMLVEGTFAASAITILN